MNQNRRPKIRQRFFIDALVPAVAAWSTSSSGFNQIACQSRNIRFSWNFLVKWRGACAVGRQPAMLQCVKMVRRHRIWCSDGSGCGSGSGDFVDVRAKSPPADRARIAEGGHAEVVLHLAEQPSRMPVVGTVDARKAHEVA